jgi:hypothetical protein
MAGLRAVRMIEIHAPPKADFIAGQGHQGVRAPVVVAL